MIRLSTDYISEIIDGKIGLGGPKLDSCALTLGSFDGLHRGHLELIKGVQNACDRLELSTGAIFTFMQHPRTVLDGHTDPFLLTTWREKLSVLQEQSCGVIIAADFCPQLAALPYKDFVEKFLVRYLGMKHLVVGYDVHLGASRLGSADTLGQLGQELGYGLEVISPVLDDGLIVSSSAIRQAVSQGDMKRANSMLGRPYSLWGEVGPGDRRGTEIGFPTANVQPLDVMKLLPETGVYAARVQVPMDVVQKGDSGALSDVVESLPEVDRQGEILSASPSHWLVYDGMLNFGFVPTFHGDGLPEPRIEVNIFDFEGDLRGRTIKVDWISHLRSEVQFDGVDELVEQLHKDEKQARNTLSKVFSDN